MIYYIWHWFGGDLPKETFKHPFTFVRAGQQVTEDLDAIKIDTMEELHEFIKQNNGVIQVKSPANSFPHWSIVVTDAKGTRWGQR
jgi:hypothetical protein